VLLDPLDRSLNLKDNAEHWLSGTQEYGQIRFVGGGSRLGEIGIGGSDVPERGYVDAEQAEKARNQS